MDRTFIIYAVLPLLVLIFPNIAHGQDGQFEGPSTMDLIILFSAAIIIVAGIAVYISRDAIMRKKTDYDMGAFESQKNRDYEKYHSDWGEETPDEDAKSDDLEEWDSKLPDYYGILGLEKTATRDEIKRQYRELAKKTHPDKTRDESSKDMVEINKAYEVLSDTEKRKRYDGLLDIS